jgi:hypothetical protein
VDADLRFHSLIPLYPEPLSLSWILTIQRGVEDYVKVQGVSVRSAAVARSENGGTPIHRGRHLSLRVLLHTVFTCKSFGE